MQRCSPWPIWLFCLIPLALLLEAPQLAQAQTYDTKGRSFWLAFIENFTGSQNNALLRMYLSCDRPATAIITYSETGHSIIVPLPVANTAVEVNLNLAFGSRTELDGADKLGTEITTRSYHVTANEDITVYAMSLETYSCDAFLVYPEDVLNDRHIVLAYQNIDSDTLNGRASMPSEFAVVATQDSTDVQIQPRERINGRPDLQPITVRLNKGEVFFGQAWERRADVSGTEVTSNQPVAVFSGIARTGMPSKEGHGRDVLIEQMLPVANWGKEVILTPFFAVTPDSPYNSYARIIALDPNTTWKIDGVNRGTLGVSRPTEIEVSGPMVITASGPILVAQYEHSIGVRSNTGGAFDDGDPFMMLAVPSEQFDSVYTFQSVTHPDLRSHFINVVIPSAVTSSLRLDGRPLVETYYPVPGTIYSYAQILLLPGSHHITASAPFGLYSYGYGGAISYGYVGGMLLRPLVRKGEIFISCNELKGLVYSNQLSKAQIDSVYLGRENLNVDVSLNLLHGSDSVEYSAKLIDPYNDGVASVKLAFKNGLTYTYLDSIPGFTVRLKGMNPDGSLLVLDTMAVFSSTSFCRTLRLENYGAFERRVEELISDPSQSLLMSMDPPLPLVMAPGETREVRLCFQGQLEHDVNISLRIADTCKDRMIAMLPLIVGVDTTAPDVLISQSVCNSSVEIEFNEGQGFYSGITEVKLDYGWNCLVEFTPFNDSVPVRSARMRLQRDDPRKDMIYRVKVRDAEGNVRTVSDTIGGFTLSMHDKAGEEMALRLARDWNAGEMVRSLRRCDSMELRNFGLRPLRLEYAHLAGNRQFSIPPAQFPMVIAPGGSARLQICLDGIVDGEQFDTLALEWGCDVRELLAMKMTINSLNGLGVDDCGTSIGIVAFGASKRTFITAPVPNPVSGNEAYLDMGLMRDEVLQLQIFDAQGNPVEPVLRDASFPAGLHRVSFNVANLPNGRYFCRLITGNGEMLVEKLEIVR